GASLRMWRDYFVDAMVIGLDNDPSALADESLLREQKIMLFYCDQSSQTYLTDMAPRLGGKFDLIIDDGSHVLEHQALTANTLIPTLLSPTGVYVVEDVIYRKELYAQL